MTLLRLAAILVGVGLGGLELFFGAAILRDSLDMPTDFGSGGIGAVSLGCGEALVELVFTAASIGFIAVAARRRGGPARLLAVG